MRNPECFLALGINPVALTLSRSAAGRAAACVGQGLAAPEAKGLARLLDPHGRELILLNHFLLATRLNRRQPMLSYSVCRDNMRHKVRHTSWPRELATLATMAINARRGLGIKQCGHTIR